MNKETLAGQKARKPSGGARPSVDDAAAAPTLDQTEDFAISAEEGDAADFLLGDDESADGGDMGDTEMAAPPTPAKKTRAPEKPKEATRKPQSAPLDETAALEEKTPTPRTSMRKAPQAEKTEVSNEADAGAPPQKEAKATVLGDYRLAKKLGQGGMGSVFKAHQVSLDREVAVKVLAKELSDKPAFVQRFLREARVMARLDHPNILRCFDVGTAKGYHYLAMEFVDGGSVEGFLKKIGRFSLGDSLHIVLTTAAALQHAHEKGLIHRDIKPDNILITNKGVIKVADLGLAKASDDDLGLTKTGTGVGTPYYMAPEQARDAKHVDGRVDIYALGVMTYVFLTGEMPFRGETLVEVIEAKEKGKYASVRKFNIEVPEKLDLVIGKMLASKPDHRYRHGRAGQPRRQVGLSRGRDLRRISSLSAKEHHHGKGGEEGAEVSRHVQADRGGGEKPAALALDQQHLPQARRRDRLSDLDVHCRRHSHRRLLRRALAAGVPRQPRRRQDRNEVTASRRNVASQGGVVPIHYVRGRVGRGRGSPARNVRNEPCQLEPDTNSRFTSSVTARSRSSFRPRKWRKCTRR